MHNIFNTVFFVISIFLHYTQGNSRLLNACPLFLTLSLQDKDLLPASLEINWGPGCNAKPHLIGLFDENPAISNSQPIFELRHINTTEGKVVTNLKVDRSTFHIYDGVPSMRKPQKFPKGKCLPFYAASFIDNELITVECFKIYPNWMSSIEHLDKLPLKNIFIPGSHASGAYVPTITTNLSKTGLTLINNYVITQHFDVLTQLMLGIRFLDLSIGFKSEQQDLTKMESFWIANENIFINPLKLILADVKRFLELTEEIVILDFSSFPIGFFGHAERHDSLVALLRQMVGEIAYRPEKQNDKSINPCYTLTMNDIKKQNKSLLILYPVEELKKPETEADILCPSWKRFSTEFFNDSKVLDYMSKLFGKKQNPIDDEVFIFQAVRTFEQSFNADKMQTTKERAMAINSKVCDWLRGPWNQFVNVLTMDFFTNTNIIDISIYANLQKVYNLMNNKYLNFEIDAYAKRT